MSEFRTTSAISTTSTKKTVELGLGGKSITAGMHIFFGEFHEILKKVSKVSSDMRPIWKVVQSEILAGIEEIFESEGKEGLPAGKDWPPLNKRYAAKKKSEIGDRKMLVYSGTMKASIQVERMTSNSLKITARDPKAPLHHLGGKIPGGKGTMPSRPFMFISDETQQRIMGALNTTIQMALNNEAYPRPKETWGKTRRKIKGL